MKSGTRLVPAFHSHWPCRSLYRYLSSFSFFFFSPSSLLTPTRFFPRRKRKEDEESFLIGCPLVSPSPLSPPSSFYFGRLAQRQLDRGTSRVLRDEDIPRVRLAKLPMFDGNGPPSSSCQRTHLRIISILSRGIRPCCKSPSPLDFFSSFSGFLSFSFSRHILHTSQSDGTRSPMGPLFFLPLSISLSLLARFISRFLRGRSPVVRTSSAILSVFFVAFPVSNQISYMKKRNTLFQNLTK